MHHTRSTTARPDAEAVRTAAAGQWPAIISALGGCDIGILDGKNHPCPKCGGTDRFRMTDDKAGRIYCNQCFRSKNDGNKGDGFAAVGWLTNRLTDRDFPLVLNQVAEYLHLPGTNGHAPQSASTGDYAPHSRQSLILRGVNEQSISVWALRKKPITAEAVRLVGGQIGKYKAAGKSYSVIAIPTWKQHPDAITGWVAMDMAGGELPADGGKTKIKILPGSSGPGVIGRLVDGATIVWKTEGPTDLLALLSIDPGASAFCNRAGASENPHGKYDWLLAALAGKEIRVIHDADKSGQDGAVKWAGFLAGTAKTCKNVILPYPIEESHGKDLRDWLAEGNTIEQLDELAERASIVPPTNDHTTSRTIELDIVSFQDFTEQYPTLRKPVIDGICREGETVNIIAASKAGKSWLSLDLAMAVATGAKWLETYHVVAGNVLYVDNELHPETLAGRLNRVREARGYDTADLADSLSVCSLRGKLVSLHDLADWFGAEIEPGAYRLIVLDAWYRLLPEGSDENNNAQMTALYNRLDAIAADLSCAFVVIHHSSKGAQGDKSVTDVGSGAGSMSRAVDTHLVIRPHQDARYSVLAGAGRSFAPIEPISIYYEYPLWHPSALEARVATRQTASQAKAVTDDIAAVTTIATEFPRRRFSCYDVRKLLGCSDARAARLCAVGVTRSILARAGARKNKQGTRQILWRAAPGPEGTP